MTWWQAKELGVYVWWWWQVVAKAVVIIADGSGLPWWHAKQSSGQAERDVAGRRSSLAVVSYRGARGWGSDRYDRLPASAAIPIWEYTQAKNSGDLEVNFPVVEVAMRGRRSNPRFTLHEEQAGRSDHSSVLCVGSLLIWALYILQWWYIFIYILITLVWFYLAIQSGSRAWGASWPFRLITSVWFCFVVEDKYRQPYMRDSIRMSLENIDRSQSMNS